ncbi:rhodanese-like domain-containing protein [Fulvimarina sp. 2208YS6-2-32]|uniref:Rhodanese-like domain-containing protein n=1 Tax=Fulvimarina uroteuthidis TaxID=3098149 RepID=A0ABU5I6Y7_9HYPH|nr:rhodanese-like domain-containing protein [Fulvimarina sp. 2208YS6-2-32]MDY8111152.1 rhodanese-like domain-containing protein [Fulvimarina sp. 2208YS6-2-32]
MTIRSAKDLIKDASASVKAISADDAVELVDQPDVVFVDVREASELEKTGTVKGAVHVPRGLIEFQADPSSSSHKAELDPGKRLVLFCASGGRSTLAAGSLQAMGFENAVSVEGGFPALQSAGIPIKKA